jgi:uncharacterized protein
MQMKGEQQLGVPAGRVWAALNDPEFLKDCVPGCESIERVTDTEFRSQLLAAIGPVKAKFAGRIVLSDLEPPRSYKITFEGAGGAAGFAKGSADVALAAEGTGTRLSYAVNAHVGGKLAQVGSRLVDGVAAKMADEFFRRFKEKLAGEVAVPVEAAPPALAAKLPLAWIAAAVIAIAAVAWYLLR